MDIRVFTRDADQIGTRPAIVLLPAFPFDHRMWDAVARRFEGLPVVSVDAPGFGGSDIPQEVPSVDVYADWVAVELMTLGISRAVIAGSSMGGYVALAILERHPKLVAGLAMVGSHADADTYTHRDKRIDLAINAMMGRAQDILITGIDSLVSAKTIKHQGDVVDMAKSWVREAPDDAIAWACRAMAARPARYTAVKETAIPIVVMRGSEDNAVKLEQAQKLADEAGTELERLEGVGHLLPIEDPAAVARSLIRLYSQCV